MRLYPALEGVSKMVAPGGVTLSSHFIPGRTNIMVKRDMKHTFMLLLSLSLPFSLPGPFPLSLPLPSAMFISNVSNVKVL